MYAYRLQGVRPTQKNPNMLHNDFKKAGGNSGEPFPLASMGVNLG
jgi:hypothetical protein